MGAWHKHKHEVLAMRNRPLDAGGVTVAIISGLIAGPSLFYAFLSPRVPVPGVHVNQWIVGILGFAFLAVGIANAVRYHNAGLAGAITGIAGGIGTLGAVVLPWFALNYAKPACAGNGDICPLSDPTTLMQFALGIGLFATIFLTVGCASLASLIAAFRTRSPRYY
jgi:nitrate/nitrite transporter NarK